MLSTGGLVGILLSAHAQPSQLTKTLLNSSLPSIKAMATVEVVEGAPCNFELAAYGWGVENSCPKQTVRSVTVTVNGIRQIVPLSAFADLAAPRSVQLSGKSSKSFMLTIAGGDASTSYKAYLKFDGTALVSRRVENGEFPRESYEATTYKFNLVPR